MKNKKMLSRIVVFIICMTFAVPLVSQEEASIINTGNPSNQSISYKSPPKFSPLRPGAIKPEGWLKDWAYSAASGITGHLDERSAVYEYGYTGKDFKAPGVKVQGTGWPIEQSAYWLDGLVRLAYILDDKALIEKAKSRLDLVVDGINGGGESLIYWRPRSDLDNTFNNWAHSHIARALVAYYQATGEKRILDALVKTYLDYPLPDMRTSVISPVSGAVNLDPLLDTYAMSGNENLLKNALAFSQRESFGRIVEEWSKDKAPDGHGVIFYENVRVPALLYPWTGNISHLNATTHALEVNNRRYGQPFGVVSSEEYMAGSGSTRYTETCNVACSSWTYHWLLQITGQSAYADRMERIFFNAGPGPVSRDFQTVSYYQAPNRDGKLLPGEEPRFGADVFTKLGHGPQCCVGNSNRVIPNYIMHMWMETPDHGLAATLYGPARVEAVVGKGTPVIIETKTNYPFESTIQMVVKPDRSVRFPLYVRIPAWCKMAKITVNGQIIPTEKNENGFVRIEREWTRKDQITLSLPMQPDVVHGREKPFPHVQHNVRDESPYFKRPLSQREDVNEPYAYVNYGPLLFALAIPDENPDKPVAGVEWNYALDIDIEQLEETIEVTHRKMPKSWHWQLKDAPIQIRVPVRQFDWHPTGLHPLPEHPVEGGRPTVITLVPYGCTKFHISMFPVTEKTWGSGLKK